MTDLRTAAQQALEDLKDLHKNHNITYAGTIAALEAALAQQAEPVEPVAWMLTDAQNPRVRFLEWQKETRAYSGDWIKTPLYTAPPQRKPLSEEEIDAIAATNLGDYEDDKWFLLFARAIERAHGIGEEK